MKRVAIVILNWNGRKMLETYLPSVLKYSRNEADVYVADNASTDDSLALLQERFPEVRLIRLERNWGFADGYNRALRLVNDDYARQVAGPVGADAWPAPEFYLLLNSDIEVTEGWLRPMIEILDQHDDIAACQPKLLSIADRGSFEYAGACGGYLDRLGYPFCRGRVFDTVERDEGQYDTVADIFWATGAALMIRSQDYWEAGALDRRFFAHNEEIDLCWRMRIRGRRIVCVPQSRVYHVGGGTLPKSNPKKTYLNFRNNLTMLYKCLPDSQLRRVMRWRWWLDYLAAWEMLLLKGNLGDFLAVYRARRDFKAWRWQFENARQEIQEDRVVEEIPEQRRFSLLWQYYVKGRKTFRQLDI